MTTVREHLQAIVDCDLNDPMKDEEHAQAALDIIDNADLFLLVGPSDGVSVRRIVIEDPEGDTP